MRERQRGVQARRGRRSARSARSARTSPRSRAPSRPRTNSGCAMVLAATSPISATANRNSTTTLSPSMRSAWRSTQALPANDADGDPDAGRAGQHQHEAQAERQRRERHRRSDEHRDQRRREERRGGDAGQQQRKRYGGVQAHQRGERRRREDRRRHHVEHQRKEQPGRTVEQIERAQARADQHRHDQHGPDRGREQEPRLCELRPQRARIDAQEGEAKQQKNGLGKERPDQRAERRQRDPEQDRNGDGIGAVAPEPGQSRCRPIEKSQIRAI